jgi:hypothetical protein
MRLYPRRLQVYRVSGPRGFPSVKSLDKDSRFKEKAENRTGTPDGVLKQL